VNVPHWVRRTFGAEIDALTVHRDRIMTPMAIVGAVVLVPLVINHVLHARIGLALAISSQTVRVHIKNIYAKLEVSDRTEAMSVALRRGIIHID